MHEHIVMPALLRHARFIYGAAMRHALTDAGYDDLPRNGLYIIGGLAMESVDIPLANLIRDLRMSKQAAGQLVDTLVMRGYLQRTVDETDRRRLTITLTERGRAAAAVQAAARQEIDAALETEVGADDLACARRVLVALIDLGMKRGAEDHAAR
jgi:DNA-binding MarR family transcriptional regulator